MTYEEAKAKLEAVGYHVEVSQGETIVYVRTYPNSMPMKLSCINGAVSARTVKCLLKAGGR